MAAQTMYEARFFFATDAEQMHGATMLGNATVLDRGDDALRMLARRMIEEDESGHALELVKTHLVVVDVGVHKSCGGLGASHPDDTLILFRPAA